MARRFSTFGSRTSTQPMATRPISARLTVWLSTRPVKPRKSSQGLFAPSSVRSHRPHTASGRKAMACTSPTALRM